MRERSRVLGRGYEEGFLVSRPDHHGEESHTPQGNLVSWGLYVIYFPLLQKKKKKKVRSGRVGSGRVGSGQVRSGQVRSPSKEP
jgi:hypothetical protein